MGSNAGTAPAGGGDHAMTGYIGDFLSSPAYWSGTLAWLLAQTTKMACYFATTRRIRLRFLVSTGGMPSAHSAAVSGLATAVGWHCGTGSPIFALALTFALQTMFDASTVRRAAGMQARILNEIIDEFFKQRQLSETKLWELLGHTRLEVFMGMIMGILTGFAVCSLFSIHGIH